jgi:F-type H+-transporting ATPase subunit b
MEFNEEFYVAVGFILFVLLVAYFGAHTKIAATLDHRAARIKAELAEAERFRAEAAEILASFEKKKVEAEAEAAALVAQAHVEAESIAKEAHTRIAEFVERRTKQAEEKIASAEALALAQVRGAAADAAVAAAETVLTSEARGGFGGELLSKGITDLKRLAS